jgi:hypothetical protein
MNRIKKKLMSTRIMGGFRSHFTVEQKELVKKEFFSRYDESFQFRQKEVLFLRSLFGFLLFHLKSPLKFPLERLGTVMFYEFILAHVIVT